MEGEYAPNSGMRIFSQKFFFGAKKLILLVIADLFRKLGVRLPRFFLHTFAIFRKNLMPH